MTPTTLPTTTGSVRRAWRLDPRREGAAEEPEARNKLRVGKVQGRMRVIGASVEIPFNSIFIFSYRREIEVLSRTHRTRSRGWNLRSTHYDDGEKETRVLEEYIKAEDGGSSDEERKRDDDRPGAHARRRQDRGALPRSVTSVEIEFQLDVVAATASTRRVRSTQGAPNTTRARSRACGRIQWKSLPAERSEFYRFDVLRRRGGRDARRGAPHPLARRRWSRQPKPEPEGRWSRPAERGR